MPKIKPQQLTKKKRKPPAPVGPEPQPGPYSETQPETEVEAEVEVRAAITGAVLERDSSRGRGIRAARRTREQAGLTGDRSDSVPAMTSPGHG